MSIDLTHSLGVKPESDRDGLRFTVFLDGADTFAKIEDRLTKAAEAVAPGRFTAEFVGNDENDADAAKGTHFVLRDKFGGDSGSDPCDVLTCLQVSSRYIERRFAYELDQDLNERWKTEYGKLPTLEQLIKFRDVQKATRYQSPLFLFSAPLGSQIGLKEGNPGIVPDSLRDPFSKNNVDLKAPKVVVLMQGEDKMDSAWLIVSEGKQFDVTKREGIQVRSWLGDFVSFEMPFSLATSLDAGTVSGAIVQEFATKGSPLYSGNSVEQIVTGKNGG